MGGYVPLALPEREREREGQRGRERRGREGETCESDERVKKENGGVKSSLTHLSAALGLN